MKFYRTRLALFVGIICALVASAIAGRGDGLYVPFNFPATTCTNQFIRSLAAATGVGTCATVNFASDGTGIVPAANGGAGTINGALKGNGSGTVSQAACADLSNGASGCSAASAAQSDQETATSTTLIVTPGRQQYHPSATKAWAAFDGTTTGTHAPTAGYNIASITRSGAGDYNVTLTVAFSSSTALACTVTARKPGAFVGVGAVNYATFDITSASVIRMLTFDTAGSLGDASSAYIACFGDQ